MTQSQDLAGRSCTPCRGGVPPLSPTEAESYRQQVPDWVLKEDATWVERRFTFADFVRAFAFVSRVAAIAEAEGHHPDIALGWGYAVVSLQTHAIKGLHENDFVMAAKIDAAAG